MTPGDKAALNRASETRLVIDARNVAAPFAVIFGEQAFGRRLARFHDFADRIEIALFAVASAVQPRARG